MVKDSMDEREQIESEEIDLGSPGWAFFDTPFDIVAIAASMGGIEVLRDVILPALPADFPVPVLVAQHRLPYGTNLLPNVLATHTHLTVKEPVDRERLRGRTVYVAPRNRHLLVGARGRLRLSDSDKVWHTRPAADPLFVSVARRYGRRAVGVVLTGMMSDGAAGATSIAMAGGCVLAQEPRTCEARNMPQAAIDTGCVDFVLPPDKIAAALVTLVMVPGAAALFRVPKMPGSDTASVVSR